MKFQRVLSAFLLLGAMFPGMAKAAEKMEITEEQRRGAALLRSAMEAGKAAAYAAVVKEPFKKEWGEVTEARFFRRPRSDDGGVDLRLELYRGRQCFAVFIQNQDGQFAMRGDGKMAVRGGEFATLFHLEYLGAEFYYWEMDYNQYQISEASYQGVPCYRVMVTVPIKDDLPALRGLTGVMISGEEEQRQFWQRHPFSREFLIGKDNLAIYSRKHYNARKKLIYSASLGKVDFAPDWSIHPGFFDTPKNILAEVGQEYSFYGLLHWEDTRHAAASNVTSWILGIAGAALLIFAFLYRKGWLGAK